MIHQRILSVLFLIDSKWLNVWANSWFEKRRQREQGRKSRGRNNHLLVKGFVVACSRKKIEAKKIQEFKKWQADYHPMSMKNKTWRSFIIALEHTLLGKPTARNIKFMQKRRIDAFSLYLCHEKLLILLPIAWFCNEWRMTFSLF